jgi:hypothetical protein
MHNQVLLGIFRHVLTAGGGVIATKYGVDGQTIEAVGGGVLALAGFLLSVLDKKSSK